MAYSLTTASSINDVLSQVCAFAVNYAGFSDQGTTTVTGNVMYRVSKDGIFWNFKQDLYTPVQGPCWRIYGLMSTVLLNGRVSTIHEGPCLATYTSLWNFPGPFPNLYLFSEGNCVHMVLEVTTGVFTHMSFGNIIKTDTINGGQYITGNFAEYRYSYKDTNGQWPYSHFGHSSNNVAFMGDNGTGVSGGNNGDQAGTCGFIRNVPTVPMLEEQGNFAPIGRAINFNILNSTQYQVAGMGGYNGINERVFRDMPNIATLRSPLLPMYVTIWDQASNLRFLAGHVPNVRLCPMDYLDPGEIILTDWIVFPLIAKEGNSIAYPPTGNYGLAYRKVL